MIRGVDCVVDKSDMDFILKRIFCGIETDKYEWVVDCATYDEVEEGRFDGQTFKDILDKSEHCTFLRIRRYPMSVRDTQLENYDQYVDSPCSLVLICVDTGYYEVYTKKKEELKVIYRNFQGISHNLLNYITEENDARTDFII